jgi:hypothetical protein
MSNKENQSIKETLTLMTELAKNQDKALKISNKLLDLKDQMIAICEKETALYKKENLRLHKILSFLFVILYIFSFISIISLLI